MLEERQGRTTVGSNKCRHGAISLCVVSEMDHVGKKLCLEVLLIKRLIVLVVGKDVGEGRATDSNF